MKRVIAGLAALMLSAVWAPPAAEARGVAVCAINGTIIFRANPQHPNQGTWETRRGTIECQGVIYGLARFLGRGPFFGSGTYATLPDGLAPCTWDLGPGNIDYSIPTSMGDVRVIEPVTAGAGMFASKTMTGTFQLLPPIADGCVPFGTGQASLVAQGVFTRRGDALLP
jgi:hypothetical protein